MAGLTPSSTQMSRAEAFVKEAGTGVSSLDLLVDGIHCPKCIADIEGGIGKLDGIVTARLNFSTRRLHVIWRNGEQSSDQILATLSDLGFEGRALDAQGERSPEDIEGRRLLVALAVAGFAAANVMLLSISIWSGMEMGEATRTLLHRISALIALPAIVFSGRPFFSSAFKALKGRRLNMDVPISLAVILTSIMSVAQAQAGSEHAYFDAAVMLLFFLLIGRYLDFQMRRRAHSAANELMSLQRLTAQVIGPDGTLHSVPATAIHEGDEVLVATGERVPVDGTMQSERADFDMSLLTGETLPSTICRGEQVFGGIINLGAPLTLRAAGSSETSTLAEIVRLMETAEQSRAKYVRLADRAAAIYAPAVHILSAATFLGWWLFGSIGWTGAATNAIAVLIITCPCALGLAVPVVQVIASGILFRRGVLAKSSDGLERLGEVNYAVFDKTGTLTTGTPMLVDEGVDKAVLARAAGLARASKHPLSQALAKAAGPGLVMDGVIEAAGFGLEATANTGVLRLGSAEWCGVTAKSNTSELELWFKAGDGTATRFLFTDALREDAHQTVADLRRLGIDVELLSGDRETAVAEAARAAGISIYQGGCTPGGKIARLEALARQGKKVLMVGDGLNDAPSLGAAYASISPASAADISQAAADFVFQGTKLSSVTLSVRVARAARSLVLENFSLALGYNILAVPLAVAGFVTPLIAALAMSGSSIVVTVNALRLHLQAKD